VCSRAEIQDEKNQTREEHREGKSLITKGQNLAADLNDESIGLASWKQADCRRWEQ
jgi:hypothetical protein